MRDSFGAVAENRHRLAWFALRFGPVARLLSSARWLAWFLVGWNATGAVIGFTLFVLTAGGLALWVPAGAVTGTVGLVAAILAAWPSSVAGALLAGGLAAVVALWWVRVEWPRWLVPTLGAGLVVTNAGVLANHFGLAGLVIWLLVLSLAVAVDLAAGWLLPSVGLLRRWAAFRRELPAVWTDVAARSERVQSIDQSVERLVAQGATDRPILEHPALGPAWTAVLDLEAWAVECPIARPEGRSFAALDQVLTEIAAQYMDIADHAGSVRLVNVKSEAASTAVLRVEFKPPALTVPHRQGGRGGELIDGQMSKRTILDGQRFFGSFFEPELDRGER